MINWISLGECNPPIQQRVLLFTSDGTCLIGIRLFRNNKEGFMTSEDGVIGENTQVTHWMPLPEPPEQEL